MNKTYLIYDTETTGTPRKYNAPFEDSDNWPHMVQLAWLLTDGTHVVDQRDYLITPEGWTIPKEATDVHGITTERATLEGYELSRVLVMFSEVVDFADLTVGHNIMFDRMIIGAECHRVQMDDFLKGVPRFCTMKETTDLCKLPGRYGNYKWPKLEELHRHLFKNDFEEAHNAAADIQATARCFFELLQSNLVTIKA
jgi:DNA polymerase III epsilon subunit-like protein